MGAPGHDTDAISSSGILTEYRATVGDWENAATMLAKILGPSETLVTCCPGKSGALTYYCIWRESISDIL